MCVCVCVCKAHPGAGELEVVGLVIHLITERCTLLRCWWWRTRLRCRRHKRCRFSPCIGKMPWRRKWQPTPVILAWRIPWTEEPGGLQSMGSQRVGHDWSDLSALPLPVPWCVTNHFNLHRLWSRNCYNPHFPVDETEVQKCARRVRVRSRWWDSYSGHRNTALHCVRPCSNLSCAAW